jgi:hypothetical protein
MRDPATQEWFITPFMARLSKVSDGDVISTLLGTVIVRIKKPLPMMPKTQGENDARKTRRSSGDEADRS